MVKPERKLGSYICGECSRIVYRNQKYCSECGSRIDWELGDQTEVPRDKLDMAIDHLQDDCSYNEISFNCLGQCDDCHINIALMFLEKEKENEKRMA